MKTSRTHRPSSWCAGLFATGLLATLSSANTLESRDEWRFNVLLDGKNLGYHKFVLNTRGAERELLSEARFNYKILFVNAYSYVHDDRELWQENCLARIDATTDDNGTSYSVNGTRGDVRFTATTVKKSIKRTDELPACVMTFAYWNPKILAATQLLNSQTGEYLPVRITEHGAEQLNVRGKPQTARRYTIVGDQLHIDLWYSTDMRWLALESTTDNGRLRYELQ
jgi:hypothetical protein